MSNFKGFYFSEKRVDMAVFSVSDIVISITLLVNCLALVSGRVMDQKRRDNENRDEVKESVPTTPDDPDDAEQQGLLPPGGLPRIEDDLLAKIFAMFARLRKLSFLIVLWNVLFIFLMTAVFSDD